MSLQKEKCRDRYERFLVPTHFFTFLLPRSQTLLDFLIALSRNLQHLSKFVSFFISSPLLVPEHFHSNVFLFVEPPNMDL